MFKVRSLMVFRQKDSTTMRRAKFNEDKVVIQKLLGLYLKSALVGLLMYMWKWPLFIQVGQLHRELGSILVHYI